MKESFQTIIYIIIFLSIFIFRFFVFDGIIIAQSTVGCSLNNPIVIINPEKNYGLPLQNVSYLVTVINRDNPLSCQVPIIYKIEVKECPSIWNCTVKDFYLRVNVGSQNSTYLFVKSNSSYIPQDFTITLNVSNKTGNNFVNTINSTIYKISDIIFNEADDYSGKYRGIALYGDLNYLNSFLNVYYENNPISNVIFNCTFSSKTCYSSGNVNTTIACTINNPSYNNFCNLNRIYCTLLNPIDNNYALTTFSRDFIPINFSLESINNISITIGESRKIPFKLISNSLLKSKYYINVSTTQPNAITLSNNNFSTELGYGYFESTYSLFLVQTPSTNPCSNCIYINATSEIGSCSKYFYQTLSSYLISLNDFDLFAVIEIILISILIFAAIIFKK